MLKSSKWEIYADAAILGEREHILFVLVSGEGPGAQLQGPEGKNEDNDFSESRTKICWALEV